MTNKLPLQDRMEEVLRDLREISTVGGRAVAYIRAGIDLRNLSHEEISRADESALSTELARRLNDVAPQ
jgi:hypothetical protein